ncbi:MAG: hypothetical protein M1820_002238 [Bogoriella megaspora]|nr:MAG: hypothetical protein M1820_002238 [Bogoriella megaspora]
MARTRPFERIHLSPISGQSTPSPQPSSPLSSLQSSIHEEIQYEDVSEPECSSPNDSTTPAPSVPNSRKRKRILVQDKPPKPIQKPKKDPGADYITCTDQTHKICRHSPQEKIELVLALLKSMNWTIHTFISTWMGFGNFKEVELNNTDRYKTTKARRQALKSTLAKGGMNVFMEDTYSNWHKEIARQLDSLTEDKYFGVHTPESGLDIENFDFSEAYSAVPLKAPLWSDVLLGLLQNQRRHRGSYGGQNLSVKRHRAIGYAITSMIVRSRAQQKSDVFCKIMYDYLARGGTKRRVVDVFAGLGLCQSYQTARISNKGTRDTKQAVEEYHTKEDHTTTKHKTKRRASKKGTAEKHKAKVHREKDHAEEDHAEEDHAEEDHAEEDHAEKDLMRKDFIGKEQTEKEYREKSPIFIYKYSDAQEVDCTHTPMEIEYTEKSPVSIHEHLDVQDVDYEYSSRI